MHPKDSFTCDNVFAPSPSPSLDIDSFPSQAYPLFNTFISPMPDQDDVSEDDDYKHTAKERGGEMAGQKRRKPYGQKRARVGRPRNSARKAALKSRNEKKRERLESNRKSARKSRLKKKLYIRQLEANVKVLLTCRIRC